MQIHGVEVKGRDIDAETRCAHYHSPRDIVALQFPCCGTFYPCYRCHEETAGHPARRWPQDRFQEKAVLCGGCGFKMSITAYLSAGFHCPACGRAFNPGCAGHYAMYFEMPE